MAKSADCNKRIVHILRLRGESNPVWKECYMEDIYTFIDEQKDGFAVLEEAGFDHTGCYRQWIIRLEDKSAYALIQEWSPR
jgi:hypothetical protein